MRKILFVHHGTGIGGAPISMLEIIKSLDKKRYDVEVLLLKDSVVRDLLVKEGVKCSVANGVFYRKLYRFFPHIEPEFYHWWQIHRILYGALVWLLSRYYFSWQLLRDYDFDILHLNSSVLVDFLPAGRSKGRVVLHVREPVARGYIGLRLGIIKHQIARYADHVIAISKDNANRLGSQDRTTVIYNSTELEKNGAQLYPSEKLVLYVGGDNYIKGFVTIVKSLDYLADDVKVMFCGYYQRSGDSETTLARILSFVRPRRQQKAVEWARRTVEAHPKALMLGVRSDIPALLRRARVLASPFSVEHFSRPIIEAFANHRCAIGTDVEGMDELIDHEENGLIVSRDNPIALAEAINKICSDDAYSMRLAAGGFEKAVRDFSRENIYGIQQIYDEL